MVQFLQTLFSENGWQLFGRFHVLTVHLPIGLLLAAAFIELHALIRRRPCPSPAAKACLFIGTVTAIVSSIMGWAHADYASFGAQQQETLFFHRWLGIAAAILALITLALYYLAERHSKIKNQKSKIVPRTYQSFTLLTAALITIAGHFGGTLTHGPDYFTITPPPPTDTKPAPSATTSHPALTFKDIQPILAERCFNCHAEKNQKAELRVDSLARLLTGGDSGPAIIPANPTASLLIRRVKGLGDDQRMPPKGPPLTDQQIQLLEAWIQSGATDAKQSP
jgi:uncharacterized membrane protein